MAQLRQIRDRQLAVDRGDTAMTASVRKIAIIRTGGQSGVDRAALDFAIEHGIPYCGWCPKGDWAEDYPDPPGLLRDYSEL